MVREVWRPVAGYPYEVSDQGRVRRAAGGMGSRAGHILAPGTTHDGYKTVKLYRNGKASKKRIHCLVAEAFIGPIPKCHDVNHINGVKDDNTLGNLEILTHLENMRHAFDFGLQPVGVERKNAKLDDDKVIEIKRHLRQGVAQKDLALRYGVHKKAIYDIKKGNRWSHV